MNAGAQYHEQRRDDLMHAARHLKTWVDDTKAQRIPPQKMAGPGAAQTMCECVQKARMHNHLALMHRNPQKHGA